MNAHRVLERIVALAGIVALLVCAAAASPSPPSAGSPSAAAVALAAAHFPEPLVATGPTTPEDDLALSRAVAAYERRTAPDDVSSLTAFLSEHPKSGWTSAVLTNLGLSYLHNGFFSRAVDAWRNAWTAGKTATEPRAKALVDRAVGELARLDAALGHVHELAALFDEIGPRAVSGSATEALQDAREVLTLVKKDPRHLFNCGPTALKSLMLRRGARNEQADFLQWYRAGPNGTSLAEVAGLADKAKFAHGLVFRKPGQPVPVPAVVHWKVGHFATVTAQRNGRFHVADPVFPGADLWVTQAALDAEASGYFLVPAGTPNGGGWRSVQTAEAAGVRGKGPTNGNRPGDAGDPLANGPGENCPMCGYDIKESTVSITLSDTPVGYVPPLGPAAKVRISYNQREDSQPQNFNFYNVSAKWTLNWLSYVTDDPSNPGASVSRFMSGGGAFYYTGYDAAAATFAAQDDDGSLLSIVAQSPISYRRQLRDGSVEIYAQSDGSAGFPRRVFLSKVIDPQGNAVTLAYDGQQRLVSLTDAVGRQTTFAYGQGSRFLLVTQITDPFGRSARLGYDAAGRLSSITDILGLTSSFGYDANSLVNAMTTPYGTTTFAYTAPGTAGAPRFAQATDPLGHSEREEWLEPAPIPDSDPAGSVPQGMPLPPVNQYLTYRDSFHWDRHAYVAAGCTPSGGCDYAKARDRHFAHVPNTSLKSTSVESVKYPLENRIWFTYPGQSNPPGSIYAGTFQQPSAVGRVLDDGTTQLSRFSYDTAAFKLTRTIDPVGRTTRFTYGANQIDLLAITQTTANGTLTPVAQFTFDDRHRPLVYTDAAGRTTTYGYNAAGQLASVTDPLNRTTTYQYDGSANLATVTDANGVTAASFTYDAFDRVATRTDSEGWTVAYEYDAADRVTRATYPDGTARVYTYDKLDLASVQDRQGRVWRYAHDAGRRLTAMTDPLGQQTLLGYDEADRQTSLTDPKSNTTTWAYDIEGRLTAKQYADTSTVTYVYESATSRLKSVTDALGQTRQYGYAKDDRLTGISYANAVNPTPNVGFAYDTYFPRVVSMSDGHGTTQYAYAAPFSPGALQPRQECFVPSGANTCGYQIDYAYDALGRPASQTVSGAGTETFGYDALGRLTSHASDLGVFALSYLGETAQVTQRRLAGTTLATTWSYLPNSGDRRLAGIGNVGLSAAQFSNFGFTTTAENFITGITETSDTAVASPAPATQTASYNNLNQLTNLSGQALSYDANGNLLADGQRTYAWDAENRLVGIGYPGQPGKATTFAYDGVGRRTAITSTPAGGGGGVTTAYVWCGTRLCQARNASNALTRSYYAEGEFVSGAPAQPLYYGIDQIGSVRRVFAGAASAQAYGYDPWGNALQATAPLTDFGYAGMFTNAQSGLYLTRYRAYDPVAGRWLSRDRIGEAGDPAANLYRYVMGDPIRLNDPNGLDPMFGGAGAYTWQEAQGYAAQQQTIPTIPMRAPDYVAINGSWIDPTGWAPSVSVDRYGDAFGSGEGYGVGVPRGFGLSIMCNWLNQPETPSRTQLTNFLSENGFNVTAGFGLGVSQSWTPGSGFATGIGISTPQVGASYSYSRPLGNVGFSW